MLSQPNKKNIKKKLNSIYRLDYSKQDLGVYANEIFRVINIHNKFVKKRKKIKISEKTSVLICYADSLLNGNKEKTIKIFRKYIKQIKSVLFMFWAPRGRSRVLNIPIDAEYYFHLNGID